MASIAELTAQNAQRWKRATLTRSFDSVAKRLCDAKNRYREVEKTTGVPWFVIAVIHERECSQRWDRSIAQGDPWNERSSHVPAGRGPFPSWEAAAEDALENCAPYAARWKDWTAGGALTLLERYNGMGYANRNLPSPYIWSGTDQYSKGKFIADHVFDPEVVDKQLGCAGLLLAMREIDPSIKFADESDPIPLPKEKPNATPQIATGFAAIMAAISAYLGLPWYAIVGGSVAVAALAFLIFKNRS